MHAGDAVIAAGVIVDVVSVVAAPETAGASLAGEVEGSELIAEGIAMRAAAKSAAEGIRLQKSLASAEQMGEAGKIIAGTGSGKVFRDAPRFAEQFGGAAEDWVKKTSSTFTAKDGRSFQTRWVENIHTGERVWYKTKLSPGA